MAVSVTMDIFQSQVLDEKGVVVADFFSETCGPCRRLAPIIEELDADYAGAVKFVKININENMELAIKYGIQAVPTIIFFKNGEEVSRTIGLTAKGELADTIDSIK